MDNYKKFISVYIIALFFNVKVIVKNHKEYWPF